MGKRRDASELAGLGELFRELLSAQLNILERIGQLGSTTATAAPVRSLRSQRRGEPSVPHSLVAELALLGAETGAELMRIILSRSLRAHADGTEDAPPTRNVVVLQGRGWKGKDDSDVPPSVRFLVENNTKVPLIPTFTVAPFLLKKGRAPLPPIRANISQPEDVDGRADSVAPTERPLLPGECRQYELTIDLSEVPEDYRATATSRIHIQYFNAVIRIGLSIRPLRYKSDEDSIPYVHIPQDISNLDPQPRPIKSVGNKPNE